MTPASVESAARTDVATPDAGPGAAPLGLPQLPGRSVVLISIDALRADHLGCLGYHRPVSPSIDRLAADSVVFEQAFTPSPTSSFALPSLHAGRPLEPVLRTGARLPPFLAELLAAAGYRTAGLYPEKIFSAGPELMGAVRASGFGFARSVHLSREARADADAVRAAVRAEPDRPLFLWVHFYDPHLPYECHDRPFGDAPIDCYDAEIAHLDRELGSLLPWLDEQLGDPILVLTGDHGEAFGEHGRLYHSADLYDEQIRVPLLLRVPGVAPRRIDRPVSIVDLGATITGLVVDDPAVALPGHDLRPLLAGRATAPPVFAALADKRAIVDGPLKLACNDWPTGPCALYDRGVDPGEQRNVVPERADVAARLLGLLEDADRAAMAELATELPVAIVHGRLRRADAVAGLAALAGDHRSAHAAEAARLLALRKDPDLADELTALQRSPSALVAAWACVGSALLDRRCPTALVAGPAGVAPALGSWRAVALARLGDPRGRAPLEAVLAGDDPIMRAEAALALGALGDRGSVPALIELLDVKQSRWAAIEALGQIGDPRAAGRLEELRRDEPDQTNEPRYRRALARIGAEAD